MKSFPELPNLTPDNRTWREIGSGIVDICSYSQPGIKVVFSPLWANP
jgi:hypothetical protein